jgi:hypothetical protein
MKKLLYSTLAILGLFATSCQDEDPPLPDNTINLSSTELGIDESESSKSFTVSLDRTSTVDVSVVLGITESGVTYGQEYSSTPAAVNSEITITIPAGQTSAVVTIQKTEGALFDGDENIVLAIKSVPDGMVSDTTSSLTITFGSIVSAGSSLTLNGGEGGSNAANSVYVDFSNNEQTAVARKSWNVGFSCGDDFAVILNGTTSGTAKEVSIAVDAVVNSVDSASYANALAITRTAEDFKILDDWAGNLSKTTIQEGKVYMVNLGESQTPLYKVKVTKKDAGTYTLQYAKINESTVKSMEVVKNSSYSFVYVSFAENKTVSVAPQKEKWDIVWGKSLYQTVSDGVTIPYAFSDLVMINAKAGVSAAEVISASAEANLAAYASFTRTNAQALQLSTGVDAIGSKWRNTVGTPLGVFTDRFYVVKDPAGHFYKLQFVKMGVNSDGGTRGYPQIKYELLK